MTYADTIDSDRHRVGFYVAFDGIEARLATHDMAAVGLSGTYYQTIVGGSLSSGERRLERKQLAVQGGGLSWACKATDAVTTLITRRGTEDRLSGAISSSDVDIDTDFGRFSEDDIVYIDRETVTLGTKSGNEYQSSDRGEFGSTATEHMDGAIVSSAPRHWKGRIAKLYAVNLDDGTEELRRTVELTGPPVHRAGVWSFSAIDVMSRFNRPLLYGWEPQQVTGQPSETTYQHTATGITLPAVQFTIPDYRHVAPGTGNARGAILVEADGEKSVWVVRPGNVTAGGVVTLVIGDQVAGKRLNIQRFKSSERITVRQVIYVTGQANRVALELMLSNEGGGTGYDMLPGRAPDVGDGVGRLRSGAGLTSSEVDTDSWLYYAGREHISLFITSTATLFDVLRDEILWRAGAYAYTTREGKLACKKMDSVSVTGNLTEYNATSHVLHSDMTSTDNEEAQIGRAIIRCNYDPTADGFGERVEISWPESEEVTGLGKAGTIEIASRSLWVGDVPSRADGGPAIVGGASRTTLRAALDRIRYRGEYGGRTRRFPVPWKYHRDLDIGDRFLLTHEYMPDHEGGIGLSAVPHEVIGVAYDYQALQIHVTAEQLTRGKILAPSFSAFGYSLGTISIDNSGEDADFHDGSAGLDFVVGAKCRIYDASASPPFSTSQTATIDAVVANSIQIDTSGLSFTPTTPDIVTLEDGANIGTPASGTGADVQDHLFAADANGTISVGEAFERDAEGWQ